jgi:hypothetical protein
MTRLSQLSFVSFNTIKAMTRFPFRPPVSADALEHSANALEVSVHDFIEKDVNTEKYVFSLNEQYGIIDEM